MRKRRKTGGATVAQPLSAPWYAAVSLVALVIALLVGWYLITNAGLLAGSNTAARSYYVLLLVLGLASAAFLFGLMKSAGRLSGHQFGATYEFGGPVVVAILVVAGGFFLTKAPEDFLLTVRLRAPEPITGLTDTWARLDLGARRDERQFSRDGEVVFTGIPSRFLDEELPIVLLSKAYRLKSPQAGYKVPASAVLYLDVERQVTSEYKVEVGARTLVGHFIGEPIVAFHLRVIADADAPISLGELAVDIKSPHGTSYNLLAAAQTSTQTANDLARPPTNWRIHRGEPLNLYLWWARMPWQMLGQALTHQVKQLPEYVSTGRAPCWNERTLSDDADQLVQRAFSSAFMWTDGSWSFKFSGNVNGKPFSTSWSIELASGEVASMKRVSQLYKTCVALNTATMFISDIPPFVEKPRQETVTTAVDADK